MPTITLKNIPTDLYERLKQVAAANHRSINSEVIVCLERAYYPRQVDVVGILERARKLRELTNGYVITDEEINRLKREGRL
jgi:antitoxin FitA